MLCLGAAATLLTTLVLHVYHFDTPTVSAPFRYLTSYVTLPFYSFIHCRRDNKFRKCTQTNKVAPVTPQRGQKLTQQKTDKGPDYAETVSQVQQFVYNWKEVAALMDNFFLWVFGFALVILSTVILGLLYAEY